MIGEIINSDNNKKETIVDDTSTIDKFNESAINDNVNQLATDGEQIYYINPENNYIYKINLDGTNNELISEHRSEKLIYYKEKLYFNDYNLGICSIDKDGSNFQIIYQNTEKPTNNFIIHNDVIYMTVLEEEQDAGYMFGFYKYNLLAGSFEKFDDSIALPHSLGLCLINNKIYYNVGEITKEYNIGTSTVKNYDMSVHHMQEFNNYIYSYSNNSIFRREVENMNEYSKIFEISEGYMLKRISVIDDLIFFSYIDENNTEGEKVAYLDSISINGKNQRNILEFKYSTLGHYSFEYIYNINNRLIVISMDNEYPMFKIYDFEGNELWSLY
jgi:hypothetical protein